MSVRFGIILMLSLITLFGCGGNLAYTQNDLAQFTQRPENIVLNFELPPGEQQAYYLPPKNNPSQAPEQLVVFFPGISTKTLGWTQFVRADEEPATGYLMIEYPGRGNSKGTMYPNNVYKTTNGALEALAERLDAPRSAIEKNMSFIGHSFGCGAALQSALRYRPRRIVLVAPFHEIRAAMRVRLPIIAELIPMKMNNIEYMHELLEDPELQVMIIHGTEDKAIDVKMGRKLAAVDKTRIVYHEIPGEGHTSILRSKRDLIIRSALGLLPIRQASRSIVSR